MKTIILSVAAGLSLAACQASTESAKPAPQDTKAETTMQTNGLIIQQSANSVAVTIDRLEAAAKAKGLNVFARIDHQKNAADMGLTMHASTLLIFGSPKIGSPLMNAAPAIGIDLPVKALAYEQDGKVYLSYNDPSYLQSRHGLTDAQSAPLRKMAKAVGMLTKHAVTTP